MTNIYARVKTSSGDAVGTNTSRCDRLDHSVANKVLFMLSLHFCYYSFEAAAAFIRDTIVGREGDLALANPGLGWGLAGPSLTRVVRALLHAHREAESEAWGAPPAEHPEKDGVAFLSWRT